MAERLKLSLWLKLLVIYWLTTFVLHFTWEILQIPFYEGMTQAEHSAAVWVCTRATFGDTGIALTAYFGAAYSARSLTWIHALPIKALASYFVIGLLITIVFEFLATEVWDRWAYSERMPTLPLLNTGLMPLAQWLVVPALGLYAFRLMYFGLRRSSA